MKKKTGKGESAVLIAVGALMVSYCFPLAIYFFLRSARRDPEYRRECRSLLLRGTLLGIPVILFSLLCSLIFALTGLKESHPLVNTLFHAFILAAFSEELMKYLLARKFIRKNRSSVSFLDVMAFTAISAIGFEMMEAVFYLFSTNVPQILVRGITCMHASFGLIMGFLLAKGYKKNRKAPALAAVLVPALIHGLYDFCLDEDLVETLWGYLALFLAVACLVLNVWNFFFMAKARKKPYYTDPLFPEEETEIPEGGTQP